MILPQNLEELKSRKLWINYTRLWSATKNGGRGGYDKPPINPTTLKDGMTNRSDTWTTYEEAAKNIGKTASHRDTKRKDPANGHPPTVETTIEGAGLVLARGYCGIDLDGVIDESGKLAPFARRILDRLNTYSEVSPSGRGLHLLLFCGDLLENAKAAEKKAYDEAIASGLLEDEAKQRARGAGDFGKQFILDAGEQITNESGKVYELEIYFYIRGGRYFTVTGKPYEDKPINHGAGAELRRIFLEYCDKVEAHRKAKTPPAPVSEKAYTATKHTPTPESDRHMIESALKAIDPATLDFGEWASIMTALKVSGFSLEEAEAFSSGALIGSGNPKNDSDTNARRWGKFAFKRGDSGAAGIIINTAKRFGWSAKDAYTDEERREYGRMKNENKEIITYDWDDEIEDDGYIAKDPGEVEEDPATTPTTPQDDTPAPVVGSLEGDEPALVTAEEWARKGYYSVTIMSEKLYREKKPGKVATSYEEYKALRDTARERGIHIISEKFKTNFPGLLDAEELIKTFEESDDRTIELKSFPLFSKAAKIRVHDSVVIAADTGAGKSSLAMNFLNDLNNDYPAIYINLEMDRLTILQRLVAIHTGLELDVIEGYKHDENTRAKVNEALRAIASRKPIQLLEDVYTVEEIEDKVKDATAEREEPTLVIIDHSLLVKTSDRKIKGRYERFTHISEELRRIARTYNIILFVLLQQNRTGKANEDEKPENSSLKESGSWENDAAKIVFLWDRSKPNERTLSITKNRGGEQADFILNYYPRSQTYTEARALTDEAKAYDWDDEIQDDGKKPTKGKRKATNGTGKRV